MIPFIACIHSCCVLLIYIKSQFHDHSSFNYNLLSCLDYFVVSRLVQMPQLWKIRSMGRIETQHRTDLTVARKRYSVSYRAKTRTTIFSLLSSIHTCKMLKTDMKKTQRTENQDSNKRYGHVCNQL